MSADVESWEDATSPAEAFSWSFNFVPIKQVKCGVSRFIIREQDTFELFVYILKVNEHNPIFRNFFRGMDL